MGNKLRVRVGKEELRVEGSMELIEQEREAFYSRIENKCSNKEDSYKLFSTPREPEKDEIVITRHTEELVTWRTIAADIKEHSEIFSMGDIVRTVLKNGEILEWGITEVTDKYIRFDARDCIADSDYCMNREWTNKGGVAESEMQEYLNTTIWGILPDDLKEVISETDRKYMDGDEIKQYRTKLFLASASEVFSEDCCHGESGLYEQMEYYKDRHNRVKLDSYKGGSAGWWLSSPTAGYSANFCTVYTSGGASGGNASNACGVVPCFIINRL